LGIAQQPALQQQQLAGNWATSSLQKTADSPEHKVLLLSGSELNSAAVAVADPAASSCLDASGAAAEGVTVALLPLGAWSAVEISSEGRLRRAEAGVVLEGGSERMLSVRQYSSEGEQGEVHEVALTLQQKQQ
jgi:hypothetical protein